MFWTVHLIGWLSLCCLVVFFLELWTVLSLGPLFFSVSVRLLCSKRQSLRCSPGRGNPPAVLWHCMWGRGSRGDSVTGSALLVFSHFLCYPQSNWALLVLISSGWVCVHSRSLWVSPMNSPLRLGVSSTATSTPTGDFNQRLWGFISSCWNPGFCSQPHSLVIPPGLSAHKCGIPQSSSHLGCESSLPWLPVSAPSTGLDGCFFNSLIVGLPYSLIFCQFWLFFVFKFVVLVLVVWGGTVCLPMPPSWLEVMNLFLICTFC